ncbi:MAG: hypothetical protein JXB47_01090 [Anaerolineae bacterium]|nr:hypothetical protein [Anaerolineae bacterium]
MGHFIRILLGLALVVLGILAVLLLARLTLPPVVDVPVAAADITSGTVIDRSLFKIESMRGLSGGALDAFITRDEFLALYEGGMIADGEMVYAGFPLSPRQIIFLDRPNPEVDRLTLLAQDGNVVFPIDVQPGQIGNYVKAGDYIDLVFTVGRVESNRIEIPPVPTYVPSLNDVGGPPIELPVQPTEAPPVVVQPANVVTPTPTPPFLELPVAVVSLPDVLILKVEREQIPNYAAAAPGLAGPGAEAAAPFLEGDVIRVYVELAPDDAAIAAFLLASGSVIAPSHRAAVGDAQPYGLTWTDFKNWYLSRRPDLFPNVEFPATPAPAPAAPVEPTPEPPVEPAPEGGS